MEIHASDILPSRRRKIMPINMGKGAHSDMESHAGQQQEQQGEIVEDKYTGEQFEIERHTDFITILPMIINDMGLNQVLEVFHSCPIDDEAQYDPNTSEVWPSEKVIEHNLSYKYQADMNKTHMTIAGDSPEFHRCLEVFEHLIPEHPDFATITYMQIVHYGKDAMFPFHKDVAEDTDFGTMIINLNDDFKGGRLNVDGNIIMNAEGTVTIFNNSTQIWHGVEPIFHGDRYVLLVWFGRDQDEMRGEGNDSSGEQPTETDGEMQSVSEDVSADGSEVSHASEEQ